MSISQDDAEILLMDDDDSWHKQVMVERRQAKAIKKSLSNKPEKKWVEPKKKN